MPSARCLPLPLFTLLCTLAWTSLAPAQTTGEEEPVAAKDGPDDVEDEVTLLLDALSVDVDALDTSDCDVACKALESMMRSAARICELDGGEPCSQARAKVEAARQKVLAACPDCGAANSATVLPPEPRPHQGGISPETRPVDPDSAGPRGGKDPQQSLPAASPPEEAARGGCAPCGLGRRDGDTAGAWLLAALGLLLVQRQRRSLR